MKVTVSSEVLGKALGAVGRAVSTRTTLPILSTVLVEAGEGVLDLTASNLDLTIHRRVAAEVQEPGRAAVPAQLLGEFVNSLPAGPLSWSLREKDRSVELRSGRFDAHIRGLDADEFPPLPAFEDGDTLSFAVDAFVLAVERVVVAAATDESRPIYAGVLVELDGSKVTMVATDGHRLALCGPLEGEGTVPEPRQLIVPGKALGEVARLARPMLGGEGRVRLSLNVSGTQVRFSGPEWEMTSRLIDGTFPSYDKVIPKATTTQVTVPAGALRDTGRAVAVFARDAANVIRLNCQEGSLGLSANTNEVGDNHGEMEAELDGEAAVIAFNAKYLLEAVALMSGSDVVLKLSGSTSPGLLQPAGDDSYSYVIMPVRVAA